VKYDNVVYWQKLQISETFSSICAVMALSKESQSNGYYLYPFIPLKKRNGEQW
jgi:hypothetical protein